MLFTADAWPGLADGSITVTIRTWTRAQAKTGGRYRVAGLLLEATDVRQVRADELTEADAVAAGEGTLDALLHRLGAPEPDRLLWRVEFHCIGRDDRAERREQADLTAEDITALKVRLDRLDARSPSGPWTRTTLRLIEKYPGVVSTALARHAKQERPAFKLNVRKLKEMGLTESLDIGYRLSPRGEALLRSLG
ncbi:MAG: hypothetical protein HY828_17350 [Actinobacteria bacterium]|nr:hypothetical protein [Actinomycetota bacterium]